MTEKTVVSVKVWGPAHVGSETHGGSVNMRDHGNSGAEPKNNAKQVRRQKPTQESLHNAGADRVTSTNLWMREVLGYSSSPLDLSTDRWERYVCPCVDEATEDPVVEQGTEPDGLPDGRMKKQTEVPTEEYVAFRFLRGKYNPIDTCLPNSTPKMPQGAMEEVKDMAHSCLEMVQGTPANPKNAQCILCKKTLPGTGQTGKLPCNETMLGNPIPCMWEPEQTESEPPRELDMDSERPVHRKDPRADRSILSGTWLEWTCACDYEQVESLPHSCVMSDTEHSPLPGRGESRGTVDCMDHDSMCYTEILGEDSLHPDDQKNEKHTFHATELLSGVDCAASVPPRDVHDEENSGSEEQLDTCIASYPYLVPVLAKTGASLSLKKSVDGVQETHIDSRKIHYREHDDCGNTGKCHCWQDETGMFHRAIHDPELAEDYVAIACECDITEQA